MEQIAGHFVFFPMIICGKYIVCDELGDFRNFDEVLRMKAFQWMKENAIVMGRTFRKYAKW